MFQSTLNSLMKLKEMQLILDWSRSVTRLPFVFGRFECIYPFILILFFRLGWKTAPKLNQVESAGTTSNISCRFQVKWSPIMKLLKFSAQALECKCLIMKINANLCKLTATDLLRVYFGALTPAYFALESDFCVTIQPSFCAHFPWLLLAPEKILIEIIIW